MFYTKYRPQKFSEIIKPNEVASSLATQVKTGKTVHAYLFVGSRGTGKTTTARILAKALNCTNIGKDGDPCDKCKNCLAIREGSFIDLYEIDAASNRGIDDIRELKDKIRLAPVSGKNKVYIIDEVHMLTNEAFNSLLKTLEEPPAHTSFILCTTELHKVPDTIKSRCQVYRFKRATITQITEKLKLICAKEKIEMTQKDMERIARASLGGYRDAETLFQQVTEGDVSLDSLINAGSKDDLIYFTSLLLTGNTPDALKFMSKTYDGGTDIFVWTGEFLKHLRDLIYLKSGVSDVLSDLSDESIDDMKNQVSQCTSLWLVSCVSKFMDAQKNVRNSFIPLLPVEVAIVEICDNNRASGNSDNPIKNSLPPVSKKAVSTEKKDLSNSSPKEDKAADKDIVEKAFDKVEEAIEASIENEDAVTDVSVDLTVLEANWTKLLQHVSKINSSIMALLKAGKPVRVDGKFLVLQVFYAFHKERLENPKNRKIVEKALSDVYDIDIKIKCEVCPDKPAKLSKGEVGVLTDMNVVVPAGNNSSVDKAGLLAAFDGGLPI